MFTIVVFSQKGGSGKSTIAIHLAVMAAHSRTVMLIDADPQGTAYAWGRLRGQRFDRKYAPIVSRGGLTRASQAEMDVDGVGMVVIDCPPNADAGVAKLLALADHIVIPIQPSMPDLASASASLAMARASGKPHSFVINRAPPRSREVQETVDALAGGGLVSPYFFGNRLDFPRSLASGDTVLDACDHYSKPVVELREYWWWLKEQLINETSEENDPCPVATNPQPA